MTHLSRVAIGAALLFFLAFALAGCSGSVGVLPPTPEGDGLVAGDSGAITKASLVFKASSSQMGAVYALAASGHTLHVSADTGLFLFVMGTGLNLSCNVFTNASQKAPVKAPATVDSLGNIYFTRTGGTRCLAAVTSGCKYLWNLNSYEYFDCKADSDTEPVLLPGEKTLLIATYQDSNKDAHIWGVDAKKGTSTWHQTLKDHNIRRSLSSGKDGSAYLATDYNGTGVLFQISATTGTPKQLFNQAYSVKAPPLAASDGTLLLGDYNSNLFSLSAAGAVRWKANAKGSVLSQPVESKGLVVVASSLYGIFTRRMDGGTSWDLSLPKVWRSGVAVDPAGTVYIGTMGHCATGGDGGCLYAVNQGKILWSYVTERSIDSTPIVHQGKVIVGDTGGNIYALKAASN